MPSSSLAVIFLLAHGVIRTVGSVAKVTCILQPAYNLEEFAEGENEEEEIRGWGPGTSGQGQSSSNRDPQRLPVAPYAESGGVSISSDSDSSGSEERYSSSAIDKSAGRPRGSMTDPSKPPGPNPAWGYWEWDRESGQWEVEDYKRKKKRRRRQAAGRTLSGKLQCEAGNLIHVTSATKGFSINNRCLPVRDACDEPSKLTPCEGRTDSCDVTVSQRYMQMCGRWTNYVRIQYECIPVEERHNICAAKSFLSRGRVVITSPSYAGSLTGAPPQSVLSCECEVSRGANDALSIPYLHVHLEVAADVCSEDMLLVDTWNSSTNRFTLKEELCGVTSRHNLTYFTDLLKLTYIPSAVRHTNGFLLRVEGKPNRNADLQITCSTTAADNGPSAGASVPTDLRNKTLAALREHINSEGGTSGQVSSRRVGTADSHGLQSGAGGGQVGDEEFNVTGRSGVLSAVVASLSSIILILGSVGMFLWYRRRNRRKEKCSASFCVRSSVRSRSDGDWMSDIGVYQDPVGPGSPVPTSIPGSPPSSMCDATSTLGPTLEPVLTKKPCSQPKGGSPAASFPPPLPVRPPRPKKEKSRPLPEEKDVQYDNPATGDVTGVDDADYAYTSIKDICDALSSQDGEMEAQTEA